MSSAKISRQIDRLIEAIEEISEAYDTIKDLRGLPKAFEELSKWLLLAEHTLRAAKSPAKKVNDGDAVNVLENHLDDCGEKADSLLEIFKKIARKSTEEFVPSVYRAVAVKLGKHRAETFMDGILEVLEGLAAHHVFKVAMQEKIEQLNKARQELAMVSPSLSDSDLDEQPGTANQYGDQNRMYSNYEGWQKNIEGDNYECHGGTMIIEVSLWPQSQTRNPLRA